MYLMLGYILGLDISWAWISLETVYLFDLIICRLSLDISWASIWYTLGLDISVLGLLGLYIH
jgi:hypothetical protein